MLYQEFTGPSARMQPTLRRSSPTSNTLATTREFTPGDHRVTDAAYQVWVVAELAEDSNSSERSHRAAQYALYLRGRQELPVELTLVRCQTAKQHLE